MKNIIKYSLIVLLLIFASCKNNTKEIFYSDNLELQTLYDKDQEERHSDTDWEIINKNDKIREQAVLGFIKNKTLHTSKDYSNAAFIFQHGEDSISYRMAIEMMEKAIQLDSTIDQNLLACAIDRELLSKNKPQIYGTQYIDNGEFVALYEIDTTIVSEEERIHLGFKTLKSHRESAKNLHIQIYGK